MESPKGLVASPLEEEDISRAAALHEGASNTVRDGLAGSKGKQRQRVEDPFEDEGSESSSDEADGGAESYPPRKDDVEEARRVEENLRRWEQAERQRRKAARDSASSIAASSLVSDVTRRASLLWSGRRSKHASQGSGVHQVLRNADDGVQLDDIDNTLSPSPTPGAGNPFATPNASTTSLNAPHHPTVMRETSDPSLPATEESEQGLLASPIPSSSAAELQPPSRSKSQPPPQPLGLPKPRTPPPRTSSPHANKPPEPIMSPRISHKDQEDEEHAESRWWTDWLCGCSERGDSQAGRTNPFE